MAKFQTPRGTRDFLPEDMARRNFIFDTIRKVYESFGFLPLETPAFESKEMLNAKGSGGDDVKNEIYYFKDKGEREMGLRFELTASLARVIACNPQLPKPFKRYQIGRVWRYDRPQAGRFREFWQADVDIVGSDSMDAEAECIAAAVSALKELGFSGFMLRLNNRKILNGLLKVAGVKESHHEDVMRVLDKVDKIGKAEVEKEFKKIVKDMSIVKELTKLLEMRGDPKGMLKKAREVLKDVTFAIEGLDELEEILNLAEVYRIYEDIEIDFSLVRGLDYYTGPVFEIFSKDFRNLGSIAGGGRYDNLVEIYGGKSTPMIGISLGVERIYEIMLKKGMFKQDSTVKVFVGYLFQEQKNVAIEIAGELRKAGISSAIELGARNIRKQMDYANSSGIPFFVVVGPEEVKEGKYTLKDMKTGKQEKLPAGELVKTLSRQL